MRLNVGDCVQLKTGGCLMTVNNVVDLATAKGIDCVWFNDAGLMRPWVFVQDCFYLRNPFRA